MFLLNQTTLRQKVVFSGIGLHSGQPSSLIIHPAPENTGIQFVKDGIFIPAIISSVKGTAFATQLHYNGVSVRTVEHFLSACMGLRLSNAFCEVVGDELPIMDGSSWPFYFALQSIGLEKQKIAQHVAIVKKVITVQQGSSIGILSPAQDQSFDISIDYDHPLIQAGGMNLKFSFKNNHYATDIARSRTYGFMKERAMYKERSLAQGADLTNSLVFNDDQVLNLDGMRFKDEVMRHKILDAIGDLSLIGGPFMGHYEAIRPGHTLNTQVVLQAFLQNAFEWVPVEQLSKYTDVIG